MDNKVWAILALVGGFLIGRNWDKIKKVIRPYAETVTQKAVGGVEEAKKFVEEQAAKAKVSKAKEAKQQPIPSDEG